MFEEFFSHYANAFLNADAVFITDTYDFPMTFFSEDGQSLQMEQDAFTANSNKLIALYQQIGLQKVRFNITATESLSEQLSLVSVLWQFINAAEQEIYQATTRYVVRLTDQGSKIKAVFVVDETSKFKALLNRQLVR